MAFRQPLNLLSIFLSSNDHAKLGRRPSRLSHVIHPAASTGDKNPMQSASRMMICLPCRRQLLDAALQRTRLPKPLHWQIRASARSNSSISSTPKTIPTQSPYTDRNFTPSLDGLDIDKPLRTGDYSSSTYGTNPTDGPREGVGFSKVPVRRTRQSNFTDHKAALKLFQNVVKHQSDQDGKRGSHFSKDLSPEVVDHYANLGQLRPMMKEQPLEDCLDFFLNTLWSKRPPGGNGLLKTRGAYLMNKVAEAKMKNFDNERLPSVAQITRIYHDLESLGSQRWSAMMMSLIKAIIAKSPSRAAYQNDEDYEMAMTRKKEFRNDLVDSWIAFHRYKMSPDSSKLQTSDEAEFRLPEIDAEQLRKFGWQQNYRGALSCIFPNWMKQLTHIPAVAVATFVLLVDPAHSDHDIRHRAKSLLAPIGVVLSACPFRQAALNDLLGPYPNVYLYVLEKWDMLVQRLHGLQKRGEKGVAEEEDAEEWAQKRDSATIRTAVAAAAVPVSHGHTPDAIRHALGMGDLRALENTWDLFWGQDDDSKRRRSLKHYGPIFDQFIMAFAALKRPTRAIDVWDVMTRVVEIRPTLLTWAAMIQGCRKAKNAVALENVWKKMVAWAQETNSVVDDKVWVSRILGLLECGEPEAGLRALSEMARLSKTGEGTKVSISVVNATVAGLLRANCPVAAKGVLTWASGLYEGKDRIEPNAITFNTLLRPMVTNGESAMIKSTLEMMGANGIKPDAATYTILLEGFINQDLDSAQQADGVRELLTNMRRNNIVATAPTLGRMLHLVLQKSTHTQDHTNAAADVVLEHMKTHGQGLTPYMYTILADHYFTRTPPALGEIDKLLTQRTDSDGSRKGDADDRFDRVFYERIIKGFAAAGDVHRAFGEFSKLDMAGAAITLNTLEILVRSLVENGRRDMAREVVNSIKARGGVTAIDGGINNSTNYSILRTINRHPKSRSWLRYWHHGFWIFAMDHRLLYVAEWMELRRGSPTHEEYAAF